MKKIIGSLIATPLLAISMQAHAIPVDVELALAIDVSGSVTTSDFNLQMAGYEAAFNNATIQNNIESLTNGIAVEVVFFSRHTTLGGIEALLTSAADATAFANTIGSLARPGSLGGSTDIADGISTSQNWLLTNNYEGDQLIIDVSGDGVSNNGLDPVGARDTAEANGITINAVAIDDPNRGFVDECLTNGYYTDNVISSDGLCVQASSFEDFARAITIKLNAETGGGGDLTSVPEPTTLALLGFGLFGLGASRRYKSR